MTGSGVAVCDFEVKGKEIEVVWARWLRKEGVPGAAGTAGAGAAAGGGRDMYPGRLRCLAVDLAHASILWSSGDRHGPEGQRTQL